MLFILAKLILAVLIIWPRGYLLAYVIDRSKNFSFGFKFFAGWIFGLAAFTIDLFSSNLFGGFKLHPWLFYFSAIGQVFGLEFVIFLFERKILWPKFNNFMPFWQKQIANFSLWSKWQKIILAIIILTSLLWSVSAIWQNESFGSANNANLIFRELFNRQELSVVKTNPAWLNSVLGQYPPNDILVKIWFSTILGRLDISAIIFGSIFYYLMLLLVFYHALPAGFDRSLKLLVTYLLSNLPVIYFLPNIAQVEIFWAILVLLVIGCLFYYLVGLGNSFFYFSGMALAFAAWTKNDALMIFFPIMVAFSLVFLQKKKINYFQLFIFWVFPVITVFPWYSYLVLNKLNLFAWYSQSLATIDFKVFLTGFVPVGLLIATFYLNRFFVKIKV
ncbi:MAG: hypothetical protein WCW26_00700 [Candidatus Buchananbacteria bacterium]